MIFDGCGVTATTDRTAYFDGIQLYREEFGSSFTYDKEGNVKSVVDLQKQETTYEYTANNLTKEILPSGVTLDYTYDSWHNVKTATTDEGLVYNFTYDTYGNNTEVSIAANGESMITTATYSTDGNRLESTTDTMGKTTTYGYNENTNVLEWVKYPEDTDATRTEYSYDEMFRLTRVGASLDTGKALWASYYYEEGKLSEIYRDGTTVYFLYGAFDLPTWIGTDGYTLASYTYTNDRNRYLEKLDYGNGDRVKYTYDDKGRVKTQQYEDGDTVTYTYDNDGALAAMTDSATGRTTTYYYDFVGRAMKYVESGTDYSHSVSYGYDDINNLTSVTETINGQAHTTNYTYNDDNRITSVTNGRSSREYSYDDFGRVTEEVSKHNGRTIVTQTPTYYAPSANATSGQVASYRVRASEFNVNYTYTYDGNGNITSISNGGKTTSYVYDSANQLIRENNQTAGKTWTWEYDNAGNILCKKEYAYTTGTLGTPTDTVVYGYNDIDWGDLLTSYDGKTVTTDAIGNMRSDGTWTYTWEHGRQLASMSSGSTTWNYTYNADGLRTSKTNGTDTYTYSYIGDKVWQFTVNGQVFYITYDGSGMPWALYTNGTIYYYITNVQGDVVAILDDTGNPVTTYTYDAWGNILSISGTMASTLGSWNPLRYRSYVYDTETGLYYLQSRYYNPEMGRFVNSDIYAATGQGLLGNNMFAYCGNNPVSRADADGEAWETVLDIISLGGSIADVAANPNNPWAWAGLVGDIVDVAIPFVGGLGEITRAAKVVTEIADTVDDVYDTSKIIDSAADMADAVGDAARKTDFYVAPSGDVIPATRSGFDYNLSNMEQRNGKYYGYDYNKNPVRVRVEQHDATPGYTGPYNPYHTSPHFHIDRKVNGKTGDFRKVITWLLEELF